MAGARFEAPAPPSYFGFDHSPPGSQTRCCSCLTSSQAPRPPAAARPAPTARPTPRPPPPPTRAGLAAVAARRIRPSGLPSLYVPAADVLVADGLAPPYRPGCADAVLCIAVLHHLSSAPRRRRMLEALVRLLRPGGSGQGPPRGSGSGCGTPWRAREPGPGAALLRSNSVAPPVQPAQRCHGFDQAWRAHPLASPPGLPSFQVAARW